MEIDDAIHKPFGSLTPFQTSKLYENCVGLASETKEVFSNDYLKTTLLKDCLTGWLRTNEINHK